MNYHDMSYCPRCKKSTNHYNGMCRICNPMKIQEYQALTYGSDVPMPDREKLGEEYRRDIDSREETSNE